MGVLEKLSVYNTLYQKSQDEEFHLKAQITQEIMNEHNLFLNFLEGILRDLHNKDKAFDKLRKELQSIEKMDTIQNFTIDLLGFQQIIERLENSISEETGRLEEKLEEYENRLYDLQKLGKKK